MTLMAELKTVSSIVNRFYNFNVTFLINAFLKCRLNFSTYMLFFFKKRNNYMVYLLDGGLISNNNLKTWIIFMELQTQRSFQFVTPSNNLVPKYLSIKIFHFIYITCKIISQSYERSMRFLLISSEQTSNLCLYSGSLIYLCISKKRRQISILQAPKNSKSKLLNIYEITISQTVGKIQSLISKQYAYSQ